MKKTSTIQYATAAGIIPSEEQKSLLRQTLQRSRAITVNEILEINRTITTVAKNDYHQNHMVLVDNKLAGLFDSWDTLKLVQFPIVIRGKLITTDRGETITIYERTITVIKEWLKEPGYGRIMARWQPIKSTLFKSQSISNPQTKSFDWCEIENLKVGDALFYEYPFQWCGNWLTNGELWLPRQAPAGVQWRHMPVYAMPRECWAQFLEALEGKMVNQLQVTRNLTVANHQTAKLEAKQTAQPRIQKIKNYHLWLGSEGCQRVALGKHLIFSVSRDNKAPLYIVDNPGVGAIYVFAENKTATDLACGKITRKEARSKCLRRIVHGIGWQQKMTEYLDKRFDNGE